MATGTARFGGFTAGPRLKYFSLFKAIRGDPDLEYALIDGTIVQVHQKATGAKGGLSIRPSGARGGLTTKIVALVDALGNLGQIPASA